MAICTIQDFIDSNSGNIIDYSKLCITENVDDYTIPIYNVLNDYLDELDEVCVTVELTEEDYMRYKYKPKLLAYDIYNNQELYFIILYINRLYSVKQFDLKELKLLKKDTLVTILSAIYNAEKKKILEYNEGNE